MNKRILDALRRSGDAVAGTGELALHLGSGMLGSTLGGVAGATSLAQGGSLDDANWALGDVANKLTYEPRTDTGRSAAALLGKSMEWMRNKLHAAPEKLQDYGMPAAAAATLATGLELAPNLISEGKPGRAGALKNIPWDEMALHDAQATAEAGAHLKRNGGGHYVGGPPKVKNPQQLAALRGTLDKLVEQGAFGGDWYERARAAIAEMAGGDPAKADKASQMLALYSPQATPDINMGHALKQWNDVVLHGDEAKAKPFYGRQAEVGRSIMKGEHLGDEDVSWLGPKVGVYEEHINPLKEEKAKVRGVNDVWMGRAYGYPSIEGSGPGAAQHSFMTGENLLAAKRAKEKGLLPAATDPNVGNVQAAVWVGKRYQELLKQKGNAATIKALRKANDLEGSLAFEAKLKKQAAQSYDDVMPKYTAAETYEQVPGRKTGHLTGAADLPYAEKQKLSDMLGWAKEGERDPLYQSLGMLERPGKAGEGFFTETVKKPTLEPALIDPKTEKVLAKGKTHFNAMMNLSPEDLKRVESGALDDWDIRGFVHNPEGVPVSRAVASKIAESFGNKDRILGDTGEKMLASEDLLGHNPEVDVQVTDKNPNFTARPMVGFKNVKGKNVALDPASESLLNQTNAFRSAMDAQAAGAWHAPENAPWRGDHYDIGNYQELPWGKEGSGDVTDWLLGKVSPKVGEKLNTQAVREALLHKNIGETEFAADHNFQVQAPREDLQKLRGMIAEHGLEGVRALVKKAGGGVAGAAKLGLPAIAISYLEGGSDEADNR